VAAPSGYDAGRSPLPALVPRHGPNQTHDLQAGRPDRGAEGADLACVARHARKGAAEGGLDGSTAGVRGPPRVGAGCARTSGGNIEPVECAARPTAHGGRAPRRTDLRGRTSR
jgi:hypothetical protein